MARLKVLLAICLALILVVAPVSFAWAGGTIPDSGDGHPWDDEANEGGLPGGDGDDTTTGTSTGGGDFTTASLPTVGGSRWVDGAFVYLWQRVSNTKIMVKMMSLGIWR